MNGNAGSIDVSVLVLSYYHEKYIAQALESGYLAAYQLE